MLPFDVLLTSYEIALSDVDFLEKLKFRLLIVDEAHRLKNSESKLYQTLQSNYRFRSSLLLSGTPIQNNMGELWSMLHFVQPNVFKSKEAFVSAFRVLNILSSNPSEEVLAERKKATASLHTIMKPFILRRTKQDVLLDLPPLTETVIFTGTTSYAPLCALCPTLMHFIIHEGLSEMQKKYYKWVLTKDGKALSENRSSLTNGGLSPSSSLPYSQNLTTLHSFNEFEKMLQSPLPI